MGAENRFAGYFIATAVGLLTYTIGCLIIFVLTAPYYPILAGSAKGAGSLTFQELRFALYLWILALFMTTVGMFLPWLLAVWMSGLFGCSGAFYFSGIAAIASLVIGCVASSLFPKPLFIEDQTFLESIRIAAERQGWLLLLAGAAGGLTYWFVSERRRQFAPTLH